MKSLQEITDYIWANSPDVQRWDKKLFERWVHFHYSYGFYCIVLDIDESIAGLALVRPIMNPEDATDAQSFDQEGRGLYIAQVVCTAKGALKAIGFAVLKRFGMREFIAWSRPPFYVTEVHKASTVRRNLLRLENAYVA